MKNILLTGGTGYIGSHTAVGLAAAGHRVMLLDNLCNSQSDVVSRIGKITGNNPLLEICDVRDTKRVRQILRFHSIDTVVHLAGLKAVGESVQQPLAYFDSNVYGAISLLHAMQAEGVKKLVFSSSATVYGQPKYLPLDEAHPIGATNPYGRTKLHIEEMMRDLAASNPSWRIAILRYFNPVGAHISGLIGENPNGVPNNLMPYITRVAKGILSYLNVWGNDYPTSDGTGVRDYIHIMDLADGHLAALNYLEKTDQACDVFNLGTGHGVSVFEILRVFEAISDCAIPFQISPRRSGDVAKCWADPTRARDLMGWRAIRSLHEMCSSAWSFAKSQN